MTNYKVNNDISQTIVNRIKKYVKGKEIGKLICKGEISKAIAKIIEEEVSKDDSK